MNSVSETTPYLGQMPLAGQVYATSLESAECRPRLDGEGKPKLAPNGKPTFSAPVFLSMATRDGSVINPKNVTVSVTEPLTTQELTKYRSEGAVWITPYIANNRISYSVIVERLVVADSKGEVK